jgi:hypothetical protein
MEMGIHTTADAADLNPRIASEVNIRMEMGIQLFGRGTCTANNFYIKCDPRRESLLEPDAVLVGRKPY